MKVLLDANLVWEPLDAGACVPHKPTRAGRPSVGVALNGSGAYFVGLDVSTTSMTAVLLDLTMNVVASRSLTVEANPQDVEAVAGQLSKLAIRVIAAAGEHQDRIRGVGVSIPGLVDRDGRVVVAPLLGWRDVDIRSLICEQLPAIDEIKVCNDAVALASAICATASPSEVDDLLLVLMSEGIGSARIEQGKVMGGWNGFAGELGQMTMSPLVSRDGSTCFQALAGERFFASLLDSRRPLIDSVRELLARGPDAALTEKLDRWAGHLAAGFLNAIWLLDPQRIVLSGPLSLLYPRVATQVNAFLASAMGGLVPPQIVVSQYGGEGAAIGAAAMMREGIFALPEFADAAQE